MVAKINVGSSLYGVLSYNQQKIDEEKGQVLCSHKMSESADGLFDIHTCLHDFQKQMPKEIRTEKPIIHISLNPHPDDILSDEQLAAIAQEYMEKLGYGDQPYLVYKHEDIDRHHLHIVSLRVDEFGNKLNDKFEHRRSKEITRELEQKYGLRTAEKGERQSVIPLQKVDYSQGNVKRQVSNAVRESVKTFRFQSFGEYRALLSLFNLTAEEVKGEHKGSPFNGLVYSVLNANGEKVGNPFKSSLFGKSVGYDALQKKMTTDKAHWKSDKTTKNRLRNDIQTAISQSNNRKDFEKTLAGKGIGVVFRENSERRIYGITFIDHSSKTVVNGSRLGKDLSANVFHEWFTSGSKPSVSIPSDKPEQPFLPASSDEEKSFSKLDTSFDNSLDFSGISLIETHGDDYEDEVFKRKMRKKKPRQPLVSRRRGFRRR